MNNIKGRRSKAAVILGSIILCIGIVFFLLRGPYLSNYIKRMIIPVLENATRERIIIDKAVINIFPFYVQAKGFKLFDRDGNRLLWITKTRAYIDVLGLLSKEVRVRKLTLKEPELTAGEDDLLRIMNTLGKTSSSGGHESYAVSLKNIKLTNGKLTYSSAKGAYAVSGSGLYIEMVSRGASSTIMVLLKNGTIKLPNQSGVDGSFDGKIRVQDNRIEVEELNISSSSSTFAAAGEILLSDEGKVEAGEFSVGTKIYAALINKIFALKNKKEGALSLDGSVKLVKQKDLEMPGFDLNLETDTQFYLETLMEILKVEAGISGRVSGKGTIKGTFPDIVAKGNVKLENAFFSTLPLDDAEGEISYKDEKFAVRGFKAHAFGGKLAGDAHILIPGGDYAVDARVADISSPRFFRFIEFEAPFPEGKISGEVRLNHESGSDIEVNAEINYLNTSLREGNVLNRLHHAYTAIELGAGVLRLKDTVLSTRRSDLFVDGIIDFNMKTLDLNLNLNSVDASDLMEPYYTKLSAPARFEGSVKGTLAAPEIKVKVSLESGSVHGIRFKEALADLSYRIGSLSVDRLVISQDDAQYDVTGSIDFRKEKEFFSFDAPFYRAKAELKNVDINPFVKVFYKEIPISGRVSGLVSFEGDSEDFVSPGDLVVSGSDIYGEQFDNISLKYELYPEKIEFSSLRLQKGESDIKGKGTLYFNKNFNLSVSSRKIQLCDFNAFNDYPFDMMFGLDLAGSGSIDNPDLNFTLNIDESLLKGIQAGKGEIRGTFRNRKLLAAGSFVDGLVTAEANALFSDRILWSVNAGFNKGRYDFLLPAVIKEVPEDFLVSLEGGVKLEGEGDKIRMSSKFDSASISLYGYEFINREDIEIEFKDNEFRIKSFSMSGKNADLSAVGTVKLNIEYNLHLKGNLEIAPLRALNDRIASLRGRGNFEIDITGPWETPAVNGEISLDHAAATLSDLPYKIGPVNGTLILKNDRITFDSVNAKFAGGSIVMSGAGDLDGLSFKRYSMSADIYGIKIKPVEGLRAALDGKLFYDTSQKGSSLTGTIDIKKTRYTKKIEWKKWLPGFSEVTKKQAAYPAFLADTVMNIHIRSADNIIIDNNIARTQIKFALYLTGTVSQMGLLGRVEADEGTVYFRSNEFNILEGTSVDFIEPDSISPFFHILADTYIGNYYVKLTLDGTMDNFALSLFSDPPLPETDILSLLTVGRTGDGGGIEGGIVTGGAAALLTGGIQDTVAEELKYYTGIEKLAIEPGTTTGGAFIPRVIVGMRLFEDKLFVTYSTAIGAVEEDSIELEYNIDRNLSVAGSLNEKGSAGADFKYKFKFK